MRPFCLLVPLLLVAAAACGGSGQEPTPRPITQIAASPPASGPATALPTRAVTTPSPTAAAVASYTVRPGDTLSRIAAANGTTVQALLAANPGINPTAIQPGQQIRLPAATPVAPGTPLPVSGTLPAGQPTPPPPPPLPTGVGTARPTIPAGGGVLTRCQDGTFSASTGPGTCSGHGGEAR